MDSSSESSSSSVRRSRKRQRCSSSSVRRSRKRKRCKNEGLLPGPSPHREARLMFLQLMAELANPDTEDQGTLESRFNFFSFLMERGISEQEGHRAWTRWIHAADRAALVLHRSYLLGGQCDFLRMKKKYDWDTIEQHCDYCCRIQGEMEVMNRRLSRRDPGVLGVPDVPGVPGVAALGFVSMLMQIGEDEISKQETAVREMDNKKKSLMAEQSSRIEKVRRSHFGVDFLRD
jgi:hypothetical protein